MKAIHAERKGEMRIWLLIEEPESGTFADGSTHSVLAAYSSAIEADEARAKYGTEGRCESGELHVFTEPDKPLSFTWCRRCGNGVTVEEVEVPRMKRKLRQQSEADLERIQEASDYVRRAVALLMRSGAKRAAARVRATIKSVDGAVRHANRCVQSSYHEARSLEEDRDRELLALEGGTLVRQDLVE